MRITPSAVALAALLFVPGGVASQVFDMTSAGPSTRVGMEVSKTIFEEAEFDFYTSVIRGRLLTPMNDRVYFSADIGLSIAGSEFASSTTLSNPEVGVLIAGDDGRTRGYATVVLPLAQEFGDDDFATGLGILYDIERIDRFPPDLWSVNAVATPVIDVGQNAEMHLVMGGSVVIPKEEGDAELFGRYGVSLARQWERFRIGAELSGYGIVSEGGLSLSERTIHQVSLKAGRSAGSGLFVRVPLDDELQGVDAIVGVSWVF